MRRIAVVVATTIALAAAAAHARYFDAIPDTTTVSVNVWMTGQMYAIPGTTQNPALARVIVNGTTGYVLIGTTIPVSGYGLICTTASLTNLYAARMFVGSSVPPNALVSFSSNPYNLSSLFVRQDATVYSGNVALQMPPWGAPPTHGVELWGSWRMIEYLAPGSNYLDITHQNNNTLMTKQSGGAMQFNVATASGLWVSAGSVDVFPTQRLYSSATYIGPFGTSGQIGIWPNTTDHAYYSAWANGAAKEAGIILGQQGTGIRWYAGMQATNWDYGIWNNGAGNMAIRFSSANSAATMASSCTAAGYRATDTSVFESSFNWTGGRVWNVPANASIASAITAASAGDTLVLAAATYTVTASLAVNKSLNIRGQGVGQTFVKGVTTAGIRVWSITASDTRIADMTIYVSTIGDTSGVNTNVATGLSNIVLENLVIVSTSDNGDCLRLAGCRSGYVNNVRCVAYQTAASNDFRAVNVSYGATFVSTGALYFRDCDFSVYGNNGGQETHAFRVSANAASTMTYVQLDGCRLFATNLGASAAARALKVETSSTAVVVAQGCYIDGNNADVYQANSAVVTLQNCTLAHNTVTGTVSYYGTMRAASSMVTGVVVCGGSMTVQGAQLLARRPTTTGTLVNFEIVQSTGPVAIGAGATVTITCGGTGFGDIGVSLPTLTPVADSSNTFRVVNSGSATNFFWRAAVYP